MPPKQVKPDPAQRDLALSFVLKPAAAATQEPQGIDEELQEHNEARLAAGFKFKNQKNATMRCPSDATHKPEIFLSKPPNQRLFWRCDTCVDAKKPQYKKLVGADNELEEDGLKTVDQDRGITNSSVTAEKLASQGSFDLPSLKRCFESIESRLIDINNGITNINNGIRKIVDIAGKSDGRAERLEALANRLSDEVQRGHTPAADPRGAMPPPHFGSPLRAVPVDPRRDRTGAEMLFGAVTEGSTGLTQPFGAIGLHVDPRGIFTSRAIPKRVRADPPSEAQVASAGEANGGAMAHGAADGGSVGPQSERLQADRSSEPEPVAERATSPSGF